MNIAVISPNQDVYSETFIRAHKEMLDANIFYYYGGELPTKLEGGLVLNSRKKRLLDVIKEYYGLNRFSLTQQALLTSFKKNKIDLVFAEYGGTGETVLPLCKELGLPLIVHFHGFDASRKDQLEIHHNYFGIFQYASYIIVVSRKMEKALLGLGCPKGKLIYNIYGPNDEFFKVTPKFSKLQFIAVGRFVDKKAPYYSILAFLEVVKKFPDARLIIAGHGELWDTCKNLVNYYNLQNNIELPGVITPKKFREYLSESLAFVQHSITAQNGDSEGTPVAILEAGASGLPIISTNHAGIPDVVLNGKSGFLVEEHDVRGMAEKMLYLLRNPSEAKVLGKVGRDNIKGNFTLNKHIKILNKLIERATKT